MNTKLVAPYRAAMIIAMIFFPAWSMADDVGSFPTHSIRVIIPFAPGGTADIVARAVTQYTTAETGWQYYVENISGAGGLVGAQAAARAKADGYTLLLCNIACATNQFLQTNVDWNPKSAISPVIVLGYVPNVLVVGPSVQVESLEDFIAQARANPGHVSIATAGPGSSSSMTAALLTSKAGIQTVEIAYRGSSAATPDLISGRVDAMVMGLPESLPLVRGGKLKALAVTSTVRAPTLPDVPTIAEAGVPGYQFSGWLSFFVPKNTPDENVSKLNAAFNKGLSSPALRSRFSGLGIQPADGLAADAGRMLDEDIDLWGPILKPKSTVESNPK